jgi:hypothetical protein
MAISKKPDLHWVHRQAGMHAQFEAQDQQMETGDTKILDYTSILGQVPDKDIWIVECDFTCTDAVAEGEYWWPEEWYLAVYKKEDGEPTSRHATPEEIALFEQEEA